MNRWWNNANTTWTSYNTSNNFQTYKITYWDPMEYKAQQVDPDQPVPDPNPKPKVKKTTVDPLDWLNERVSEITELVEI